MNQLPGTLIVTGASRGIGASTAILAAARGWSVLINYRKDQSSAEAVRDEIAKGDGKAICHRADVSRESEVVQMFDIASKELGPVRGLVNNAGTLETQCRLEDMDADRLSRIFAVNITGSFLCAREAVKMMSTRHGGNGGVIVNVSSAAARLGSGNEYVDYAASKGAIDTMTRGLANEVAAEGIRVNAVRPGFINTEIHAQGGEPDRLERIRPTIPLGRAGEAEEVAQAILWLLSDESSYCTGGFIDCAGGR